MDSEEQLAIVYVPFVRSQIKFFEPSQKCLERHTIAMQLKCLRSRSVFAARGSFSQLVNLIIILARVDSHGSRQVA